MDEKLLLVLGLSFIGSIAGLIGGYIFLIKESWARKLTIVAVPFAAGVLISVSIIHILPEAYEQAGKPVFLLLLVSFLASFLFEQYFAFLHHHQEQNLPDMASSVPLVIFGDTIHNFIDGVAIAASFLTNANFGLVVALATFLHETPHEIGDFGLLLAAGWSRKKTVVVNTLSALTTFPGALLVYYWLGDTSVIVGWLLAVSAGIFLYLGASDFLPRLRKDHHHHANLNSIIPLILGVVIIYLLSKFLSHA